jgi:SPIRAL1-like protein
MSNEITPYAVDDLLKPLLLKDLRIQCRARGLNPGGGRETLYERLKENMLKTGNTCV